MHRTTTSSRTALPEDDGWAIFAQAPGARDLGQAEYWQVSQERSKRRREAQRRPRVARGPATRVSVALAAAAIGAPVAVSATGADTASAATTTGASGNLNVRLGSTGQSVSLLQRHLGINADGVFGPRTLNAVKAFQRAHGLVVDGIVGPVTTRALGIQGASAATISYTPAASVSLSADTIRFVQRQVGVTADGVLGPRTRAALRSFEARWGLPADGVPDAATLRALGVRGSGSSSGSGSTTPVSTSGSSSSSTGSASSSRGAGAAVRAAMTQIGKPYQWGATGPSSFDCSGLVQWAFRQAGVSLPRTSFSMYGVGSPVSSIQAGDLVFFNTAGPGASDVGIAISSSQAVSATSHGVMTHEIRSGYWGSHFVGARRVG